MSKKTEKKEDFMQSKWRPMMAMMYMIVCIFDFIAFPIMFTVVQFWETQAANDAFRQWNPITLLGGGLFHVAMGAVLGVSAWSRGQEKIAGVASTTVPALPSPTGFATPTAPSGGFGQPAPSYSESYHSTTTTTFGAAPVSTGWGGKKAPPQPDFYPER